MLFWQSILNRLVLYSYPWFKKKKKMVKLKEGSLLWRVYSVVVWKKRERDETVWFYFQWTELNSHIIISNIIILVTSKDIKYILKIPFLRDFWRAVLYYYWKTATISVICLKSLNPYNFFKINSSLCQLCHITKHKQIIWTM